MGDEMMMNLNTMAEIQTEKAKELESGQPELDAEGTRMAEEKRKTFDLPTNAVKVDPLR